MVDVLARVVVIGNIASDETFAVEALPHPGASIPARALSAGLGGKGANQAIVLGRALAGYGNVRLVSAIGQDARGAGLAAAMAGEPVDTELFQRDLASDVSIILRDSARENTIVTTQSCAQSITGDEAIRALTDADTLVLQGNLAPATSMAALHAAGRRGILRVLNPSPMAGCTAEMLAAAEILVTNEGEAAGFGGAALLSQGKALIRTLGAAGAELWQDGECRITVPGQRVAALDPTGAGDCFLGMLIAAMLRRGSRVPVRADLERAARAAALCVSRLGTQKAFPTAEECAAAFAAG